MKVLGLVPEAGPHRKYQNGLPWEVTLAYSLRDKAFKYSGSLTLNLWPANELGMTMLYLNDVRESGGMRFNEIWSLSGSAFIRDYMVEVMDMTEEAEISLGFRAFKYLTAKAYLAHSELTPTNGYGYSLNEENPQVILNHFLYYRSRDQAEVCLIRKHL